jgi:penicillin amidase
MSISRIGTRAKRRSLFLRVSLWVVLSIVVIIAGVSGYAYYVAYSALPQMDGQLKLPGLSSTVKVTRDGHGVPMIEASSLEDLFFAQGFVTAQDRLWQMDMMRRYARGELSEILGEDLVKVDREQRVLGMLVAAKKSLARVYQPRGADAAPSRSGRGLLKIQAV